MNSQVALDTGLSLVVLLLFVQNGVSGGDRMSGMSLIGKADLLAF
jgi:hypothetical protein